MWVCTFTFFSAWARNTSSMELKTLLGFSNLSSSIQKVRYAQPSTISWEGVMTGSPEAGEKILLVDSMRVTASI